MRYLRFLVFVYLMLKTVKNVLNDVVIIFMQFIVILLCRFYLNSLPILKTILYMFLLSHHLLPGNLFNLIRFLGITKSKDPQVVHQITAITLG